MKYKRRIEGLRAKHPGIRWEPWISERLEQQKVDKTVPAATVPDDGPSAPNDSPEKSSNELLAGHIQNDFRPYCAGGRRHRNAGRSGGARTDHHRLHVAEDNAVADVWFARIQAGGSGSGGCSWVISRWRASTDFRACRCTKSVFPAAGGPA